MVRTGLSKRQLQRARLSKIQQGYYAAENFPPQISSGSRGSSQRCSVVDLNMSLDTIPENQYQYNRNLMGVQIQEKKTRMKESKLLHTRHREVKPKNTDEGHKPIASFSRALQQLSKTIVVHIIILQ